MEMLLSEVKNLEVVLPDGVIPVLYSGSVGTLSGDDLYAYEVAKGVSMLDEYGYITDTEGGAFINDQDVWDALLEVMDGPDERARKAQVNRVFDGDGGGKIAGKQALNDFVSQRFVEAIKSPDVLVICPEAQYAGSSVPDKVLYRTELPTLRAKRVVKRVNGFDARGIMMMDDLARAKELGALSEAVLAGWSFDVTLKYDFIRGRSVWHVTRVAEGSVLSIRGAKIFGFPDDSVLIAKLGLSKWKRMSLAERICARVGYVATRVAASAAKSTVGAVAKSKFAKYFPVAMGGLGALGVGVSIYIYGAWGEAFADSLQAAANGCDAEDVRVALEEKVNAVAALSNQLESDLMSEVIIGGLGSMIFGGAAAWAITVGGLATAYFAITVVKNMMEGPIGDHLRVVAEVSALVEAQTGAVTCGDFELRDPTTDPYPGGGGGSGGGGGGSGGGSGSHDGDYGGAAGGNGKAGGHAKKDAGDAAPPSDPIVVDTAGDGFSPTDLAGGAYFDLNVDGYAERVNWVRGDDWVLAWDRNRNGRIDNGLEVFGDSTRLVSGAAAGSGYAALAELDSNGDRAIDPGDTLWPDLVLWADVANLGKTDAGELRSLDESDVKSISLETSRLDQTVDVGVVLGEASQVVFGDGLAHQAAEYWVSAVDWDTVEPDLDDGAVVPADVLALPNVRSLGSVPSLRRAVMADQSGRLRQLIGSFTASRDTVEREGSVRELVLRIMGADEVALGSRGSNFNAQELAAIEAILGGKFNGVSGPNPNAQAAQILHGVWTRLFEIYYCELLYQTHLLPMREVLKEELITDGRLDVGGAVSYVADLPVGDSATGDMVADLGRFLFYAQQGGVKGLDALAAALGPASVGLYRDMPQVGSMMWFGTDGNDTLSTTAGWPTAYGMGGNDTLNGSAAADELYGGAGNDRLNGNAGADLLDGGTDDDTLDGGAGDDHLVAGPGDDTVYAGAGEDLLVGGAGDDRLEGGAGADVYDLSGGGADVVADYDQDTVVLAPDGVDPGSASASKSGYDLVLGWDGGSARFLNWFSYSDGRYKFAELRFSDGTVWTVDDVKQLDWVVTGTEGNDNIGAVPYAKGFYYALGGNDTVNSGSSADVIHAGPGDDTVYAGAGEDLLVGGAGDDRLDGGAGADVYDLSGGGADVVTDSDNDTVVILPAGVVAGDLTAARVSNSLVFVYPGGSLEYQNWFYYSVGTSQYDAYYKPALFRFADGAEMGAQAIKDFRWVFEGTDGADVLSGSPYKVSEFRGFGGDDTITGAGSADTLVGGAGDDKLYGQGGDDVLDGGPGDDRLDGGAGADVYKPGFGVNTLADSDSNTVVEFPAGVAPEDLTASKSGSGLAFLYPGGSLEYQNWFYYSVGTSQYDAYYKPAAFKFADGTVWTVAQVKALV